MHQHYKKSIATALFLFFGLINSGFAKESLQIDIVYLSHQPKQGPVLSNLLPEPADSGEQGARLGISDSNTTGRFLGHDYKLKTFQSEQIESVLEKVTAWSEASFWVLNMPADSLVKVTDALKDKPVIIFNAGSPEDQLRQKQCLPKLLHTLPSRAMLADALGQWMISRKLKKWLLISGERDGDKAFADAIRRTAKRMGGKIVADKVWNFETDLRRTAQKELPVFTQTKEYDMVLVADELGDFGEYVPYNTWYPRPVAGTQGLTPVAWHRVVEQWGAAQLQSRFEEQSGRWMNSKDFASWVAVRSLAEAVTRTGKIDSKTVFNYLFSDKFQLAAFKGRKLSYRPWSGQLRQPIPLVHPRALVAQAPLEGYLHPKTELDTLGYDQRESQCQAAQSFPE